MTSLTFTNKRNTANAVKPEREAVQGAFGINKFAATGEQQEILNAFNQGRNLKIHAFAGTGKTSTLIYISRHTEKSGLYFVFNNKVAKEAKSKMPDNMETSTMHAFARRWAASSFEEKKLHDNMSYPTLINDIDIKTLLTELEKKRNAGFDDSLCDDEEVLKKPYISSWKFIKITLESVKKFCISKDESINAKHIQDAGKAVGICKEVMDEYESDFINIVSRIWDKMKNPNNKFPLGYDGYLKLWAMTKPKLSGYDFLFLDEGQDLNPVMLVVLDSFSGQKILVGDAQQQVYDWRGAENAMGYAFKADDFYLTETFRFGNEIAKLANNVLKHLYVGKQIVSANPNESIVTTKMEWDINAYLFRKNIPLIMTALAFFRKGKDFYIADDNKNINTIVNDYHLLHDGKWGKSSIFENYNNWDKAVAAAKSGEYGLKGYVDLLSNNDVGEIEKALKFSKRKQAKGKNAWDKYPTLSTIHQAKGAEWAIVVLNDEFNIDFDAVDFSEVDEELRLLYVGITRARRRLIISKRLLIFCEHHLEINNPPTKNTVLMTEHNEG